MRIALTLLAAIGTAWAALPALMPALPPAPSPTPSPTAQPASPPAPAPSGPRAVIDAGAYFDPASPTAGLQAAIDAVGASGGLVSVPPGAYLLRRGLVLPSGVTLRGSGPATVLRLAPAAMSLLAADCPAGIDEVRVQNAAGFGVGTEVSIRDSQMGGWYVTHAIVKAVGAGRIVLDRKTARDYKTARGAAMLGVFPAVTAKGQADLAVEDLRIDGDLAHQPPGMSVDFTYAAVHLVDCRRPRVRDVLVTAWPSDGIGVQGGSDALVTGCQAVACKGHGFHPGTSLRGGAFVGNIGRDNGQDGLYFCAQVHNLTVSNNVFSGNAWSGIGGLGDGGDEWNVCAGNVCSDNGRAGIHIVAGRNNTVTGNVCVGNSRSRAGEWAGIALDDATGCSVTGNRCGDDAPQPTQLSGIREGGKSDRNLIAANHVGGSRKPVEKVGPKTIVSLNME